ncbi:hypothetical protein [Arenimonas composti]|uniref:PepSY domain-containing protein n=1 Tax=Arenimonas composti TR7-09 = DSM 18010 TaxID=1121013 RepID=A0A091C3K5_9GAMM|nr:hypothetical protein [Arenimonas composti]KFN51240.1 hypothetical protein P873_02965 [Arenimonas composti TR7-09 = DSM 18010]
MKTPRFLLLPLAAALAFSAQATTPVPGLPEPLPPPGLDEAGVQQRAADAFFANLAPLCGQAFAGRVVADTPPSANDPFSTQPLVMHVRECDVDVVRISLHVGEDRSRTWVITRTENGLRLKHDHRHADGSPDPVTMYGGDTTGAGSETRQAFPVDAESIAMFEREGLAASVSNTWAMEHAPGRRFLYELSRPNGRLFQIEFDLTAPQPVPPQAWGAIPR